MGLLVHIHQSGQEVSLALRGQLRDSELLQLGAIITHFQRRGCRTFVVDLSRAEPLTPAAARSLKKLMGTGMAAADRTLKHSAIRLLADTPAARKSAGRGVHILPAA